MGMKSAVYTILGLIVYLFTVRAEEDSLKESNLFGMFGSGGRGGGYGYSSSWGSGSPSYSGSWGYGSGAGSDLVQDMGLVMDQDSDMDQDTEVDLDMEADSDMVEGLEVVQHVEQEPELRWQLVQLVGERQVLRKLRQKLALALIASTKVRRH